MNPESRGSQYISAVLVINWRALWELASNKAKSAPQWFSLQGTNACSSFSAWVQIKICLSFQSLQKEEEN